MQNTAIIHTQTRSRSLPHVTVLNSMQPVINYRCISLSADMLQWSA